MVRLDETTPQDLLYPTLVYGAQASVLVPAAAVGIYDPDNPKDSLVVKQADASAKANPPRLIAALRWATSVVPGTVMVIAVGATAWVITSRWWSASLASFLAAVTAIDLKFGTFITPDGLTGATVALALLASVLVFKRPSLRRYLLVGATVGLACSAKYNAIVVITALLAADWLAHGRSVEAIRKRLAAGGLAAAVFILLNHAVVLKPSDLWEGLTGISRAYRTSGHHSHHEGTTILFNAATLWWSAGFALILAAVALVYGRRDRQLRGGVIILGWFAVAYIFYMSSFVARFERNLMPLTPAVAVLAAIGLKVIVDRRWARRRCCGRSTLILGPRRRGGSIRMRRWVLQ